MPSSIEGPLCSSHFNSLEAICAVDLDSDYYSSRWKDINGFWVCIDTFTTFVGGDSDN
jgi:hypothetical protein